VAGYERARWSALRHFIRAASIPPPGRVLDYGAGSGLYIPLWRELFPDARLFACDVSRVALERLRDAHPDVRSELIGNAAPFEPGSFDVVTSVEVIEHVADLEAFLADVRRLLRPDGVFVWTTPCANRGSIEHLWSLLTGQIDSTPDGSRRWRWEDSTHVRRLRTAEIRAALIRHGFHRIRIRLRSHVFSWTCTKLCRGPLRPLRSPLTTLDYKLFRLLPNGASMLGAAVADPAFARAGEFATSP
jgi:SAM-dependent methyltransferase